MGRCHGKVPFKSPARVPFAVLPPFSLERWLRAQEKRARLAIGGSGVAGGDITPYLPSDLARAWATHPDDASRMLREAVARQFGVPSEHVLPTVGASEADAAAILGFAGPGARVLVEQPAYHALVAPARAFGCRVERVRREGPDHALRIDRLSADVKLVVLARPHNPTGAVVPTEELRALGEDAARVGAWVLVDEVFADATELDHPACRVHPRIVSVNSVTKCLGFSGLRCGWAAATPDAIEAIDRAKSYLSVQNALIDLQIAARVLEDRPKLLQRTRATRRACAAVLREFLAGSPRVRGRVPEHGTTTLLRLPDGVDDLAFAERLAAQRGVVAAPGSCIETPGHLRVGLVGDPAALREGLGEVERMAAASTRA